MYLLYEDTAIHHKEIDHMHLHLIYSKVFMCVS